MDWGSLLSAQNAAPVISIIVGIVILVGLALIIFLSQRRAGAAHAEETAWEATRLYYSSEISEARRFARSLLTDLMWQRVVSRDQYQAYFGQSEQARVGVGPIVEQRRRNEESLRFLLSFYDRLGLLLKNRAVSADSIMPLIGEELRATNEVLESAARYGASASWTGLSSLRETYRNWTETGRSGFAPKLPPTQDSEDIQVFSVGDHTITFVRNPERTLGAVRGAAWAAECIPVARQGFGSEGITESDIYLHVMKVSHALFLRDAEGRMVAFSSTVIKGDRDPRIIYLEGTALLPEAQHAGWYRVLVPARILFAIEALGDAHGKSTLISTRTQSPVVFRYMSRRLGLFPRPDVAPPASLVPIAAAFAQEVFDKHSDFRSKDGLAFDKATFVMRRAYGNTDADGNEHGFCMYGDNVPWTRDDDAINDFVRTNLNLQDGDAILLIGQCDKARALSLLEEGVRRLSPDDLSLLRRLQA